MRRFEKARVTAYGYGPDNAYKGHPDGGDVVSRTHDPKRNFDHAAHAILGSGSFQSPTTIAVQPELGIPPGSMVYVYDRGWFVVEDECEVGLPGPRFDMWSGPSNKSEMSALDARLNVVVYTNAAHVPADLKAFGPSHTWTAHFNKMRDRIKTQGLSLFVSS